MLRFLMSVAFAALALGGVAVGTADAQRPRPPEPPRSERGEERSGDAKVPKQHMPPPGMCRIWLDGVPAGQQPAPTDCATAIRKRPANGTVVFGPREKSGAEDRRPPVKKDLRGSPPPVRIRIPPFG